MPRPKVYITRGVRPAVLARLGDACETRGWAGPGRCPAEVLEKEVGDVAAVLGTDRWTAELMDKAPNLRIIALTAVGYDSVDVAAATERGIIVTNTAGSLTDTVADLALALMLASPLAGILFKIEPTLMYTISFGLILVSILVGLRRIQGAEIKAQEEAS